jgi:SAM-dependent methyltransferase
VHRPDVTQDGRAGRAEKHAPEHHDDADPDDQTARRVIQRAQNEQEPEAELGRPEHRALVEAGGSDHRLVQRTVDASARYGHDTDDRDRQTENAGNDLSRAHHQPRRRDPRFGSRISGLDDITMFDNAHFGARIYWADAQPGSGATLNSHEGTPRLGEPVPGGNAYPLGVQNSPDWGVGQYEWTARQLLPAAGMVVDTAAIRPDERVLDLGCGTGNAALLAAQRGARVTGVDPAPRLLDVARKTAADRGADIDFLPGDAASIPVADASVDVVLSVFAVIFAPDPPGAAAELARVVAPGGRIALSAWIPGGAISEMNGVAAASVQEALGTPPRPQPFPWHELDAVSALLSPHGFHVTMDEHRLAFSASSARDYLDEESRSHPLAVAGMAVLEPRGEADAVRQRMLEILEHANEDPEAFRVTSRYVVAQANRAD